LAIVHFVEDSFCRSEYSVHSTGDHKLQPRLHTVSIPCACDIHSESVIHAAHIQHASSEIKRLFQGSEAERQEPIIACLENRAWSSDMGMTSSKSGF